MRMSCKRTQCSELTGTSNRENTRQTHTWHRFVGKKFSRLLDSFWMYTMWLSSPINVSISSVELVHRPPAWPEVMTSFYCHALCKVCVLYVIFWPKHTFDSSASDSPCKFIVFSYLFDMSSKKSGPWSSNTPKFEEKRHSTRNLPALNQNRPRLA